MVGVGVAIGRLWSPDQRLGWFTEVRGEGLRGA